MIATPHAQTCRRTKREVGRSHNHNAQAVPGGNAKLFVSVSVAVCVKARSCSMFYDMVRFIGLTDRRHQVERHIMLSVRTRYTCFYCRN